MLLGPESARLQLIGVERLRGDRLHSDGAAVLNDDLVDLGIAREIEVGVNSARGVDVGMSAVTSSASLIASGKYHKFQKLYCMDSHLG